MAEASDDAAQALMLLSYFVLSRCVSPCYQTSQLAGKHAGTSSIFNITFTDRPEGLLLRSLTKGPQDLKSPLARAPVSRRRRLAPSLLLLGLAALVSSAVRLFAFSFIGQRVAKLWLRLRLRLRAALSGPPSFVRANVDKGWIG